MKGLLFLAGCLFRAIIASPVGDTNFQSDVNVNFTFSRNGTVKTSDGVHLKYMQAGPPTGQNVLFIPGWRQSAAQWQKNVKSFSEAGYHVTAYDMRGHGESEKPNFGYRISRFASDLHDLLTQLDLKDTSIVAHSMGSSVTWALWDQYPETRKRLDHLVFVDQSAVLARNPNWTDEQAEKVSALFGVTEAYDFAEDIGAQTPPFVKSMFSPNVSSADYEFALAQNEKMSDANAATLLINHVFQDWRDVLPRINIPSLVIAGEISVNAPTGISWVASQIPGAKNYTFSAAEYGSHFMFWENPERFQAVIGDFLTA